MSDPPLAVQDPMIGVISRSRQITSSIKTASCHELRTTRPIKKSAQDNSAHVVPISEDNSVQIAPTLEDLSVHENQTRPLLMY